MIAGWGMLVRLCLVNAAIGGLAALPVNLFNRLMTVELALPALLPGLLVALHYGVQLTRPVWGHRSDVKGGRTPFILGGIAVVALGVTGAAWGILIAETSVPLALAVWLLSYAAIGLGIGAAGTSFLALLACVTGPRKGAGATLAWLLLIAGAIFASVGTGIALEPYSPDRLVWVVAAVCAVAFLLCVLATIGVESHAEFEHTPDDTPLVVALKRTWADPVARRFTGFVFLSILAFYLSELIFEPFAGHVHGLSPEDSIKLSGGKDGAALMGMIAAGVLSHLRIGSLRFWAVTGCVLSAFGLLGLGTGLPLVPSTVVLGLGNGLFVVGAVGSMMQLAAAHARNTGTRMGVFGAAQAIAAGLAGLVATGMLDLTRLILLDAAAYGTVFTFEAALFLCAALVASRVMRATETTDATLVPGE
ncbi:MFS transporter [Tateyamaria omphalii]|uniref:PucC family protein n=1 Tax=Tateyamaria omphalii TaxID=299262 RepID=UPI00167483B2|nr:PucC family protein [Tateyamaria omphalii]GGX69396.1 MFS transporter [Tateyamaria omphalii]